MLGWLDSWRDSEWRDGALGMTGGGYSELSGDGRFGITRGSVRDEGEGRPLGRPLFGGGVGFGIGRYCGVVVVVREGGEGWVPACARTRGHSAPARPVIMVGPRMREDTGRGRDGNEIPRGTRNGMMGRSELQVAGIWNHQACGKG